MCKVLNDFVEFVIILINSLFILSNPVQLKAGFTPRNICKIINANINVYYIKKNVLLMLPPLVKSIISHISIINNLIRVYCSIFV